MNRIRASCTMLRWGAILVAAGSMWAATGMAAAGTASVAGQAPAIPPPAQAERIFSRRYFYPHGSNPQALMLEVRIYRYRHGDGERYFWRYRLTNYLRFESPDAPYLVTEFALRVPSGAASARFAAPDGWMSTPASVDVIGWRAPAGAAATLLPGESAEFAFTTERRFPVPGSGAVQLKAMNADMPYDLAGDSAPDVPGELMPQAPVDCCLPYRNGHICGAYNTAEECIAHQGTVGCENCGTNIVSCCCAGSDCGVYAEDVCVGMDCDVVASCSDCGTCQRL